jgi:hypothetical protein
VYNFQYFVTALTGLAGIQHYLKGVAMGFRWRKSIGIGPIQANLSSRGVGWSINLGVCRLGVNPQGKPYVSAGVPGTGLYFIKNLDTIREKPPQETPSLPPVAKDINSTPSNQSILDQIKNGAEK